jgi:hypothetical protein
MMMGHEWVWGFLGGIRVGRGNGKDTER